MEFEPPAMSGGILLLVLFFLFCLFSIVTLVFQKLWDTTVPQIFGLPQITFWQAFRLLLMAWIVFGGITLGGSS